MAEFRKGAQIQQCVNVSHFMYSPLSLLSHRTVNSKARSSKADEAGYDFDSVDGLHYKLSSAKCKSALSIRHLAD